MRIIPIIAAKIHFFQTTTKLHYVSIKSRTFAKKTQ